GYPDWNPGDAESGAGGPDSGRGHSDRGADRPDRGAAIRISERMARISARVVRIRAAVTGARVALITPTLFSRPPDPLPHREKRETVGVGRAARAFNWSSCAIVARCAERTLRMPFSPSPGEGGRAGDGRGGRGVRARAGGSDGRSRPLSPGGWGRGRERGVGGVRGPLYQTWQAFSRTIGDLAGQLKAFWNSGMLETTPLTR